MDWFDRLPKVELHIHLEGAIPVPTLWELVQKYGGDPETPTLADLERRFSYRDFQHFLQTWVWKNQFLRELDDFTFVAEAVARYLASQRVRYAEAFYSPVRFGVVGLEPQAITRALREGLDRVSTVDVRLVVDLVRNFGPDAAERTLDAVNEAREYGVIGIGIGGSEHAYPPEPFAGVYERARALGFRTTAHAGEADGSASIWGAIRALRVDRIGHGTRAHEDNELLDYLAHSRLPLEMCPISNVRTGVVSDLSAHPIRRYVDRGLLVTINTDDPAMFNTSLAEEYRQLHIVHGFGDDEIRSLLTNAVDASWRSTTDKQTLQSSLEADPAWGEGSGS